MIESVSSLKYLNIISIKELWFIIKLKKIKKNKLKRSGE